MSNEIAKPEDAPALPSLSTLMPHGGSPALQIMLDDRLFDRAKLMATYLSKAEGFTPPHLIGKPEACFAVVTRALTWKLDPFAVAQSTYQTPGGRVGYEGKLCQAILENSGKVEGPVTYEHYGDWSKVQGKFKIAKSERGKEYAVPSWSNDDAVGLGVTVRAKVKGETKPREWSFDLIQAFPRNSTLWATDPKTQICYTAVRRFGSVAAPGLFMGVPFDRDDMDYFGPEHAKDVTPPRPIREEYLDAEDKKRVEAAQKRREEAEAKDMDEAYKGTTEAADGDRPEAEGPEPTPDADAKKSQADAKAQAKADPKPAARQVRAEATATAYQVVEWDGTVSDHPHAGRFTDAMVRAIEAAPDLGALKGVRESNADGLERLKGDGDQGPEWYAELVAAYDGRAADLAPAKGGAAKQGALV